MVKGFDFEAVSVGSAQTARFSSGDLFVWRKLRASGLGVPGFTPACEFRSAAWIKICTGVKTDLGTSVWTFSFETSLLENTTSCAGFWPIWPARFLLSISHLLRNEIQQSPLW